MMDIINVLMCVGITPTDPMKLFSNTRGVIDQNKTRSEFSPVRFRGGFKVSFLNYCIMQVVKSISSFSEVLRDLRGCGSLALPVAVVPDFVAFCAQFGVYPCGGALTGPESAPLQWLYID